MEVMKRNFVKNVCIFFTILVVKSLIVACSFANEIPNYNLKDPNLKPKQFAQAQENYKVKFSTYTSNLLKAELYRPIKLQSNKILFPGRTSYSVIFDANKGVFKKISACEDIGNGILLNNGKVLFVAPLMFTPIEEYSHEILNKYGSHENDRWAKFRKRSDYQNEVKYLPYINKDPEFLKKYKAYRDKYFKSMYAQLFDPVTETFEYTGKVNIRRRDFNKVLLKDGRVLIVGGCAKGNPKLLPTEEDEIAKDNANRFEIYDPATGKFELVPNVRAEKWNNSFPAFVLKNGNVYSTAGEIFNPYAKTVTKAMKLEGSNFVQLSDDRIVFIGWDKKFDNTSIKIYNPYEDAVTKVAELLVPRGEHGGSLVVMKDDIILIHGGVNSERSGPFMGTVYENRLEIFNPNIKQQKILSNRYCSYLYEGILLDDGRLFLTTTNKTHITLLTLKNN